MKKRWMKRCMICLFAALLLSVAALAEDPDAPTDTIFPDISTIGPIQNVDSTIASGECGEGVSWKIVVRGWLVISGEGAITSAPWLDVDYPVSEVYIEEGVTAICSDAFSQYADLERAEIAGSVETIGAFAFMSCPKLREVVMGEGVKTIEGCAFSCCKSLVSADIPSTVTSLGIGAFECCALKEVTIPGGITEIPFGAFLECPDLERVTIESGVESIGGGAFVFNSRLQEVTIPETVTTIQNRAFGDCDMLREVTVPEGVTYLLDEAFSGCDSLQVVSLPSTLSYMHGNHIFSSCDNLTDIYYNGTRVEWEAIEVELTSGGTIDGQPEWDSLPDSVVPGNATLFYSDNYVDSVDLYVVSRPVAGGTAVRMLAVPVFGRSLGEIRYTLDGSTPCKGSPLYTEQIFLEEMGDYTIRARAYVDSAYGDIETLACEVGKSAAPVITEENGIISMAGEGEIFYTLNLAQTPTTADYAYTGPLTFNKTTAIKARVIEAGKEASDVVSYTYEYTDRSPLVYPEDTYSFANTNKSFGYSFLYRIPEVRYTEIFGGSMGKLFYNVYGGYWGGSCFGMSASSLLFHKNLLSLEDYSDRAQTVYELLAPASPESALTQLIERYQVSQLLPSVMEEREELEVVSGLSGNTQAGEDLLASVRQACNGGDPVVLIISTATGSKHAVVPYRVEDGKIWVYDCAYPGEEKYITYYQNSNQIYNFTYEMYNYSVACNYFSTLLEGLENLQAGGAVLMEEETEMLLLSSSSDGLTIHDENEREVTDYLRYRVTDLDAQKTVAYLELDTYDVTNSDGAADSWTVSAATQDEFCSVTVSDPNARVRVGKKSGHLYLAVYAEENTVIDFCVSSGGGAEHEMSVISDYAEVSATSNSVTIIQTNASDATINGVESMLSRPQMGGMLLGAAVQNVGATAPGSYTEVEYELRTDITRLPDADFVLTAYVTGADSGSMVCAASYDANEKLVAVRSVSIQSGKTRYVFTIEKGTEEVRLFLMDGDGGFPLIEHLSLLKAEE